MTKGDFLKHWIGVRPNQPISPTPVGYKHEGSTYDCDGIRVTGSRAFIDSVLSRLKDLLPYENGGTRLHVAYQQSKDRKTGQSLDAFNCYVQVHRRGGEAQAVNEAFDLGSPYAAEIAQASGGALTGGRVRRRAAAAADAAPAGAA